EVLQAVLGRQGEAAHAHRRQPPAGQAVQHVDRPVRRQVDLAGVGGGRVEAQVGPGGDVGRLPAAPAGGAELLDLVQEAGLLPLTRDRRQGEAYPVAADGVGEAVELLAQDGRVVAGDVDE